MPPALTVRDWTWGASWAVGICAAHALTWGYSMPELVQFVIQFTVSAFALIVPGLLLFNLRARRARAGISLRWQVVAILVVASLIAMFPWNSPSVGCLEC